VYSIEYTPAAVRDLKALERRIQAQVLKRIETLQEHPTPHGVEKLTDRYEYRLRSGDYRVLFAIDFHGRRVIIGRVRHRREVYR